MTEGKEHGFLYFVHFTLQCKLKIQYANTRLASFGHRSLHSKAKSSTTFSKDEKKKKREGGWGSSERLVKANDHKLLTVICENLAFCFRNWRDLGVRFANFSGWWWWLHATSEKPWRRRGGVSKRTHFFCSMFHNHPLLQLFFPLLAVVKNSKQKRCEKND